MKVLFLCGLTPRSCVFFVPCQPPPYTGVTAANSPFTGPLGIVKVTMTSTCPCLFTSAGGQEACAQVNVEAMPVTKNASAFWVHRLPPCVPASSSYPQLAQPESVTNVCRPERLCLFSFLPVLSFLSFSQMSPCSMFLALKLARSTLAHY